MTSARARAYRSPRTLEQPSSLFLRLFSAAPRATIALYFDFAYFRPLRRYRALQCSAIGTAVRVTSAMQKFIIIVGRSIWVRQYRAGQIVSAAKTRATGRSRVSSDSGERFRQFVEGKSREIFIRGTRMKEQTLGSEKQERLDCSRYDLR